ncbi:hypothetical protein C8J55DRAFT_557589 [Lentinula edodes]|uniref:Uncharacterized protein n=1 Tax=Lentinula lateritia TaxID=40482 RepID=A0A9W9DWK9_9AGAR|nr:hypothetical protein C8J55DRAFT_557589 [Lentinula edodes]
MAFNYKSNSYRCALFDDRLEPGGIYDELVDSFTTMGPSAIANAEYGEHFFRRNFGDTWSGHYSYHDAQSLEFSANLFGEILGEVHGTFIGAQGNHFPGLNGNRPNQLTDHSKACRTIVLGCPSFAPAALKNLWYNQLCTFAGIRDADIKEEKRSLDTVEVKEITKGLDSSTHLDAITLSGGLIYELPIKPKNDSRKLNEAEHGRKMYKKRAYNEHNNDAPIDIESSRLLKPYKWPLASEIYCGALYDHRLMPDFGGPLFALKKAKPVQPDWRDVDGSLIVPWKNFSLLRPGTLVVANISIRVHVLIAKNPKLPKRKVYQAIINSLKVVAKSDVPVATPVAALMGTEGSLSPRRTSAALKAFDAIGSSSKCSSTMNKPTNEANAFDFLPSDEDMVDDNNTIAHKKSKTV